ncbi:MAG: hypothetical protein Q4D81_07965 [Eubacteriales bacterium]|nr:hypothetical protein [Eubacteriales bacterium]
MKTRFRLLSVVLAAVMLIGTAVCVHAEPPAAEHHVELTEVGSFTNGGLRVLYNCFLEGAGNNSAYVYAPDGSKITEDAVSNVEFLENGMYELTKADAEDINSKALVNADGKILIPFENAFYSWPSDSYNKSQSRFILVYYGTEETESQEEALFYITDALIAVGGPKKDDVMYKGYVRIYDIEKEQFVENIQFEQFDKYDTLHIVGGSILVQNEDKTYTLYDAEGKKLLDLGSRIENNAAFIVEKDDTGSGYKIYDESGKEVSSGTGSAYPFTSTSNYLSTYGNGSYTVIDASGKQVLSKPVSTVYSEDHGIFRVQTDSDSKGKQFIDADGNVLGETEGDYYSLGYGVTAVETGVKTFTLFGPAGNIAEEIRDEKYGTLFSKDGSVIAYNDGSGYVPYSEDTNYTIYKDFVLLVDPSGSDPLALYDMFTGNKLLDDGFTSVYNLGDRIVLEYKNGSDCTYKTFEITIAEGK